MESGTVHPELHTFRSVQLQSIVQEAVQFLQNTPAHTLPPATGFNGVGVYALYYRGNFAIYDYLARQNRPKCNCPIYVGKAVPSGWRTARSPRTDNVKNLYGRLREHARSIHSAKNLELNDFQCRFIILDGIESDLIAAVESTLIRLYKPLWNTIVDGFGNHDPGKGRYNQARSEWDVLQSGRVWADRLMGPSPELENIIAKVEEHRTGQRLRNSTTASYS